MTNRKRPKVAAPAAAKARGARLRIPSPRGAAELLDRYFLDMRSALLETAAAFDRIERAEGGDDIRSDPRLAKLRAACGIVAGDEGKRAERFLILFSDA